MYKSKVKRNKEILASVALAMNLVVNIVVVVKKIIWLMIKNQSSQDILDKKLELKEDTFVVQYLQRYSMKYI